MEPTTRINPLRSVLIFLVIGLVLLGAVVLGVRWAKGRSDSLAQNANKPTTVVQKPEQKPSAPSTSSSSTPSSVPSSQASTPTTPQPAATQPSTAQTTPQSLPTPKTVPSTGPADLLLQAISLGALVFLSFRYVQSRQRLARLS